MTTESTRDGGRGEHPPAPAPAHAAPDRSVGDGPYRRLILRNVTLADGTGAPPYGPVDVVIEGNRIQSIFVLPPLGGPRLQPPERPAAGPDGHELDLTGHWVLPGLIDAHGHIGWENHVPGAQYVYDLWLANGITTVREPGCFINGLDFVAGEARRSAANAIAAPRIHPYAGFGLGRREPFATADEAARWVGEVAAAGATGLKLWGYGREIYEATLREANRLGLGTMCHHQQSYVVQANALDSARWGLGSIEHWYGLPEALFADRRFQDFSPDYNYQDEFRRFADAGRLWAQAAPAGSPHYERVLGELVATGVTLDPTFGVYVGLRDAERVQSSYWHADYTSPMLWDYWQPHSGGHGSFFDEWGTEQETAWRENFRLWMSFVKDFHDRGGRVTVGTDPGSIFTLFGFAYAQELELLREAGLRPLEIVHAATLAGAELLGVSGETGSVEPGKLADLLVVPANPLANLKVLYATHPSLSPGGRRLTIKDGIVYDAAALLGRVRETVAEERERRTAGFAS
jgi:hypothetical protein